VGATVRSLGDGDGTTQKTATFDMIAPAGAVLDTLRVRLTATDRNTSDDVPPVVLVLPVEVVLRSQLTLSAAVTAPPDAIDLNVTVGTPFTVTANVANVAGGADIAAPGQLRITVPTGKGYQLAAGEQATKSFAIGADVEWVVEAAPQPSGPDDITIAIVLPAPSDENSATPALIDGGPATISMNTEGAAVTVLDVTTSLGIDTKVAPAGARDLRVFGFNLEYSNSDQLAADARIDTIAVTVVNRNGTPLSDAAVRRTLSRVFIQLGTAAAYETATLTTNPVVVAFAGAGAERVVAPGGNQTAVVGLDLGGDPAETEIRLQIRGAGKGRRIESAPGRHRALERTAARRPPDLAAPRDTRRQLRRVRAQLPQPLPRRERDDTDRILHERAGSSFGKDLLAHRRPRVRGERPQRRRARRGRSARDRMGRAQPPGRGGAQRDLHMRAQRGVEFGEDPNRGGEVT